MASASPAEDFARGLATVLETLAGVQPGHDGVETGEYAEFDGGELPRMDLDAENARVYDNPLRVWIPMRDGGFVTLRVSYDPASPS